MCETKTEGLVHYPTTLAPASGTLSVTTQCADNAHRTSSSLSVTCNSSGIWGGQTPQCQCDSGYQAITKNGREICQTANHTLGIIYICIIIVNMDFIMQLSFFVIKYR